MAPTAPPWLPRLEQAMAADRPRPRVHFATVAIPGGPAVRTVILRGLLGDGTPYFHTDLRSEKVRELRREARAAMVVWFEATAEQFRLSGEATVHGDRAASPFDRLRASMWTRLPDTERRMWLGPAPGTLQGEWAELPVTRSETPPESFAVVSLHVARVDYLKLGPPHLREHFLLGPSGWRSERVHP